MSRYIQPSLCLGVSALFLASDENQPARIASFEIDLDTILARWVDDYGSNTL